MANKNLGYKGPPPSFYRRCNAMYARKYAEKVKIEIEDRPDLKQLLSSRVDEFASWAGKHRLDYEADIDEEVIEFLDDSPKDGVRLYNTNVKEWKRLSCEVFKRDNYTCTYCGVYGAVKLECDHIVPFSKGGTNDLSNLTTACQKCNRQKRDKSVEEFLTWKANGKN